MNESDHINKILKRAFFHWSALILIVYPAIMGIYHVNILVTFFSSMGVGAAWGLWRVLNVDLNV